MSTSHQTRFKQISQLQKKKIKNKKFACKKRKICKKIQTKQTNISTNTQIINKIIIVGALTIPKDAPKHVLNKKNKHATLIHIQTHFATKNKKNKKNKKN